MVLTFGREGSLPHCTFQDRFGLDCDLFLPCCHFDCVLLATDGELHLVTASPAVKLTVNYLLKGHKLQ